MREGFRMELPDAQVLALTLEDAIKRGLQFNLGISGAGEVARQARAQRLAATAQMLPDLLATCERACKRSIWRPRVSESPCRSPDFQFPTVIGPFNNFDARASVRESLSFSGFRNRQSSRELAHSAALSPQDSGE